MLDAGLGEPITLVGLLVESDDQLHTKLFEDGHVVFRSEGSHLTCWII